MRKKMFLAGIALCAYFPIFAGGLLTNTNQSVYFLRNPARGASIEIDAAFTNPAGLAFLPKDGLFFSVNSQSAFQTRTNAASFEPFKGMGGDANKSFKGKTTAWVIPNIQAAYKKGDWVFSANIGIAGGGGSVDYSKGLASFESTLAIVPAVLSQIQPAFGGYSLESQLKGSSIIYGGQLGATYTVSEHFSAYAGVRYSYVDNSYDGYLKDIKLGLGGNLLPAQAILAMSPAFASLAPLVSDKALDCRQTGSGVAPIIGLDYNWNGLNIGAKYEFKTNIDLKNETTVNSTGLTDYNDGVATPYDIPALFTLGAQYDLTSAWRVSASFHHFFDSDADMANGKQQDINGGISEYLAGVEYKINNLFLVSCGGQITRTGVTDNYQSDMSFSLNSYSLGFGGAINLTENIRLNLAYFFTRYENWEKQSFDYGKISAITNNAIPATGGTDIFGRTNTSLGIGVDFRF
jgi:long-chain fatty acid transport protein